MLTIGDIVYFPWEPEEFYEITGVPGDEWYDQRGFVSAEHGCTFKVLGTIEGPNDWSWTFRDSFQIVDQNPAWEV